MSVGIVLAVFAALSNAASNVLQRKANRDEPTELQLHPKLIWDLLHKPVWLAGMGTVVLSFVLMAAALGQGQLASIQPIIVMELPATLILGSWVFDSQLRKREWIATGLLTGGLAGLIGFLGPQQGNPSVGWQTWVIGISASVALIGVLIVLSQDGESGRRAAFLGAATGVAFGLTAALMKGMTMQFHHGIVGVLSAWQSYVMIFAGIGGMLLMQSALNAGRLITAQPGITLLDPMVAIVWGVLGFHEGVHGGILLALAIASGFVMGAGGYMLSRSPLLEGQLAEREEGEDVDNRKAKREEAYAN